MPTTSSLLDKQLTPLTPEEEELFTRIRARLEAYFRDFEELEGFSVLSSNIDRLLRKVALELRCVCYEYHDSFLVLEALRAENEGLREDMQRRDTLCDQVIAECEAAKARFQAIQEDHTQAIEKLHAFYAAQDSLRHKQWAIEADTLRQHEMEGLVKQHDAKMEILKLEHAQQLEATKKQFESAKQAELEYMEVQLRLQITSQVSRDLGKKLAHQEKLCEKHTSEMKHMRQRIASLQDAAKATVRKEVTTRR